MKVEKNRITFYRTLTETHNREKIITKLPSNRVREKKRSETNDFLQYFLNLMDKSEGLAPSLFTQKGVPP
jgi:hypothetical protein